VRPLTFYAITLTVLLADQVTKAAVLKSIPLHATRPALGDFMVLTHTRNTGGAFSILPAGNTVFIVIAFFAVLALVYAYHRYQRSHLLVSAALALALGGAVGNVIDRVRYGNVVDFFDLHLWTGRNVWPIFNVADSAITVGIVLLALHFLFAKDPAEADRKRESVAPQPTSDQSNP
jgi:signal peptidase II